MLAYLLAGILWYAASKERMLGKMHDPHLLTKNFGQQKPLLRGLHQSIRSNRK
jgi:hypothetical protein